MRLLLQTGKEDSNIMFPNHAKSHRIDRMDFFLIIVKARAPPLARASAGRHLIECFSYLSQSEEYRLVQERSGMGKRCAMDVYFSGKKT